MSASDARPAAASSTGYPSVTEIATRLKRAVETELPDVRFEGEASGITVARSGHVYLTIKDAGAQLSAVVWAGTARTIGFKLEEGMQLLCHGKPTVYLPSGRLQIILHRVMPSGDGLLRKKFEALKRKLEQEGFFAPERKRPLPFLPRAVGVVSSAAGAVIHDIEVKIRERMPNMPVYLADVPVQGEGAAPRIAAGLRELAASGLVDVIILARGGGSLEDLWAFNEEVVVKAVFACPVPVVCGVGHEVDYSLADLAADLRAPTPTAAAELVVPRRSDLLARVAELEGRLDQVERWLQPLAQRADELAGRFDRRMAALVSERRLELRNAASALRSIEPKRLLESYRHRIDALGERLGGAFSRQLGAKQRELERRAAAVARSSPEPKILLARERLQYDAARLRGSITAFVERRAEKLGNLRSSLEAVNPERVLRRGYSIVSRGGEVVRSAADLSAGDLLAVQFADDAATAAVKETDRNAKFSVRRYGGG